MASDRSILRRALSEPLVQFAGPAALLFLLNGWSSRAAGDEIRVSPEIVEALAAERELVLGRPLEAGERLTLVDEFVADEVLLREAFARGLPRHDGKIREHLIDKMSFLLDEEAPEPTREELEAFYREHLDFYRTQASLDLEHAYFEQPPADPAAVLESLRRAGSPELVGDPFYLGSRMTFVTPLELGTVLGRGFAQALEGLEEGRWHGPIPSSRGVHFARVVERHPARQLPEREVEPRLAEDWARAWVDDHRARRVSELRARYRVVGPDVEAAE